MGALRRSLPLLMVLSLLAGCGFAPPRVDAAGRYALTEVNGMPVPAQIGGVRMLRGSLDLRDNGAYVLALEMVGQSRSDRGAYSAGPGMVYFGSQSEGGIGLTGTGRLRGRTLTATLPLAADRSVLLTFSRAY